MVAAAQIRALDGGEKIAKAPVILLEPMYQAQKRGCTLPIG